MKDVAMDDLEKGQFIVANDGELRGIYAGAWCSDALAVFAPDTSKFPIEKKMIGIGLADHQESYQVLDDSELTEEELFWVEDARRAASSYVEFQR